MAFGANYSVPAGQIDGDTSTPPGAAAGTKQSDDLSRTFGPVFVLRADIGAKATEHLLVAGYVTLGFGAVGSDYTSSCSTNGVSCSTFQWRLGIEVAYQFLPSERLNPWVGYGIGLEEMTFSAHGPGGDGTVSAGGFELGHLMAGLDARLTPGFGLGPIVDFSFGEYSSLRSVVNGTTQSGDVNNEAFHAWLTFGVRGVVFP